MPERERAKALHQFIPLVDLFRNSWFMFFLYTFSIKKKRVIFLVHAREHQMPLARVIGLEKK